MQNHLAPQDLLLSYIYNIYRDSNFPTHQSDPAGLKLENNIEVFAVINLYQSQKPQEKCFSTNEVIDATSFEKKWEHHNSGRIHPVKIKGKQPGTANGTQML